MASVKKPFTVRWADGRSSTLRSSSSGFERHNSQIWWFLRFGPTIISINFPTDVYDALPAGISPRFTMLADAIVEWARQQTTVEWRYEVSLIAQLENGRLHMI